MKFNNLLPGAGLSALVSTGRAAGANVNARARGGRIWLAAFER